MTKMTCNICGKEFDQFDDMQHLAIYAHLGYGSKYDGEDLAMNICQECMDKLIEQCKISPLRSPVFTVIPEVSDEDDSTVTFIK